MRMFRYSGLEEDLEEDLEKYAYAFLAQVLEGKDMPAELQGFLLNCKECPSSKAVDAWIASHIVPGNAAATTKKAVEKEHTEHSSCSHVKDVSNTPSSRLPDLVLNFAPGVSEKRE